MEWSDSSGSDHESRTIRNDRRPKSRKLPDLDRSTERAERLLIASETMAEWHGGRSHLGEGCSFRAPMYRGDTNAAYKQRYAAGRETVGFGHEKANF